MDFKPLIQYLQNQIKNGFFWMKIYNPKDISDPIVQAINKKEYETVDPELISEPIVEALGETTQAIKDINIPEVTIPEVDFTEVSGLLRELINKKDKDIIVKQGDVKIKIDTDKILKILKKLEEKEPQEQIDYTPILSEICELLEGIDRPIDLSKIEKFLDEFKFPELPMEDGRLKVSLTEEQMAKIRAHFMSSDHLVNKLNVRINPATEEGIQEVKTAIENLNQENLLKYKLSEIDDGEPIYLGYVDADGAWIIKRIEETGTVKYKKGASGFDWSTHTSGTYNYYNLI